MQGNLCMTAEALHALLVWLSLASSLSERSRGPLASVAHEADQQRMPMASGDAQRTWFPAMIALLGQTWSPSMAEGEWLALRDRLDTLLQTMRRERQIVSALMWCPHCHARHRAAPPTVSVRAMLLALGRFRMASAAEVKVLERRWNAYRRQHHLDRYGMPEAGVEPPGP
jgi:hypothetical protein